MFGLLTRLRRLRRQDAPVINRDTLYQTIATTVPALVGWCSVEKATEIARLIVEEKAAVYVEIGVFGGRSLIPAAMAMKANGAGTASGIDPWSTDASLTGTMADVDREWWTEVDHERTFSDFVGNVLKLDLLPFCAWHRTTSDKAVGLFSSIDILHIDGNHSVEQSIRDVTAYLPKMKPSGVVIFDDVDWPSTRRAWQILDERCKRERQIDSAVFYRVPAS